MCSRCAQKSSPTAESAGIDVQRALDVLRSVQFAAPLESSAATAKIRADYGLDFAKSRVRTGFSRGHLLDIVVTLPGGAGSAREHDAAEALVRLLLGEERFEHWVGKVSATPTARGGPLVVLNQQASDGSALPLESLPETVNAAIAALRRGLPELRAASVESDDWVLFELEPEPAPDFAAQDDLLVCSTRMPEAKKCFLQGEPFFSGRFTSSGALFAYLKYEPRAAGAELRLAERARFETQILRALSPECGVIVGLGLGSRYDYIDLALIDPHAVSERLLPVLRSASISNRAWILFFDSLLAREHIPVHADAPAPYWG